MCHIQTYVPAEQHLAQRNERCLPTAPISKLSAARLPGFGPLSALPLPCPCPAPLAHLAGERGAGGAEGDGHAVLGGQRQNLADLLLVDHLLGGRGQEHGGGGMERRTAAV